MVDGVWKGIQSLVIGRSDQLSQNKFLDQRAPSMRKGRDGNEKKMEQAELGVPHSKSKLSWPNQNFGPK